MTLIRAGAFAESPADDDAPLHLGNEFRRDEFELIVAHGLHDTAIGSEILGEFDQFLDDLHRADGAVVLRDCIVTEIQPRARNANDNLNTP